MPILAARQPGAARMSCEMGDGMNVAQSDRSTNGRHRWAEKYPWLGTGPVAADVCYTAEHFAKERDQIFKHIWWQVAVESEIPNKRDFKVRRLDFAHASVIVVRGDDGAIRAFHNSCSHRGNKPIKEKGWDTYGSARANAITCRFHGWVYNTRGELMMAPEQENFYDLDLSRCGLTPIACEVWNGFVFINLDPSPSQTLAEFLGDMGKHLEGFPYGQMTYRYVNQAVIKANWKVCADAFQEAYHVNTIHAGTFPDAFDTGVYDVLLAGPHRTAGVLLRPETMKPTPITELFAKSNLGNHPTGEFDKADKRTRSMLPPQFNPQNYPNWGFELAIIFPFFNIGPAEGFLFSHNFYPIDQDRTLWEGSVYLRQPSGWGDRMALEYTRVLQRDAWLEDTETMEDTHEALKSGGKAELLLQDGEILCRHNYYAVRRYLEHGKPWSGWFASGEMK